MLKIVATLGCLAMVACAAENEAKIAVDDWARFECRDYREGNDLSFIVEVSGYDEATPRAGALDLRAGDDLEICLMSDGFHVRRQTPRPLFIGALVDGVPMEDGVMRYGNMRIVTRAPVIFDDLNAVIRIENTTEVYGMNIMGPFTLWISEASVRGAADL